jgi:MFS transporter, FHS family, L-fucose permease
MVKKYNFNMPLMAIMSLFFLWALAHNLNPILIPQLKKACQLNDMQSALVDSSFYIAYFLMALPGGFIIKRFGYQKTIVLGLSLFSAGAFLFYPAAGMAYYPLFLLALFIIASGITLLETAANPYVSILGDPNTSAQRLNFAQAFNGLGATLAALFGSKFILSDADAGADSTRIPYLVIGSIVFLVMLLFLIIKLPEVKEENQHKDLPFSLKRLWQYPQLRMGVVAQFFYVGAQVGIGSFFIRYVTQQTNIDNETAALYLSLGLLLFMLGRFIGAGLMKFIKAEKLLLYYCLINMALLLWVILKNGEFSIYALISTQFFMSIMFPSIFAMGIKNMGSDTRFGSSLIIMSIVGGAFVPLAMGAISDSFGITWAFAVPWICFLIIAFTAFKNFKWNQL